MTGGQRHDSPQFQPVLVGIRVLRIGPGRPRTKPDKVRADKAYGSRATRYDKLAVRYETTVLVAATNEWL